MPGPDERIDAYLFDLDGTLVDSEHLWSAALAEYLRSRGKTVSYPQANAWVFGRAWHDIYANVIASWPDLAIGVERMEDELRPFYLALRSNGDVRIHSSIALLRQLATHTPVAIVSGSPNRDIADAIDHMGVADCLAFFLGSSDYSPGKPDPICFLTAAKRLAVPPSRCVVFEDSSAGILAARRAGMAVVALARPEALRQNVEPADVVLADLSDFSSDVLFAALAARTPA
jgi:HAD superfamily hydrolase (TIGR01509 family)